MVGFGWVRILCCGEVRCFLLVGNHRIFILNNQSIKKSDLSGNILAPEDKSSKNQDTLNPRLSGKITKHQEKKKTRIKFMLWCQPKVVLEFKN